LSIISMPLHRYGSILETLNTIYRIITKFIKIIRELLNILYYMWYIIWQLAVNTITVTRSPWWIVYWVVCFERGVPQEVRMYSLVSVPVIIWWSCGFCADFVHYPVHHVRLWLLTHPYDYNHNTLGSGTNVNKLIVCYGWSSDYSLYNNAL
jgi:hypothetical protein